MRERIKMLARTLIVHDPPYLLGDLRQALSLRPSLVDYPRRLAKQLKTDEHEILVCLEALRIEDEVLA
jgi:hypothetical protein